MNRRTASWLAWSLATLSLIMFAVSVALYLATLPVHPTSSWGTGGISAVLYVYLPFLAFPRGHGPVSGGDRRSENPRERS